MTGFVLVLSAAVAVWVSALLYAVVRARNKRLLLDVTRGASCDAPDSIGISVLCSGVMELEHVENLLTPEYVRYEVVVVLDARRYPDEFAALAARYRIIRVEYAPTWELPVAGVRALGRSRKRGLRRMVLVDRAGESSAGDFDAAASVASYDYLLPLREGQYLLPGAIERLVTELGERPAGELGLVRSWVGEPVALFARWAVVAAGGFRHHPVRQVLRAHRRTLWEPVCCTSQPVRAVRARVKTFVAVLIAVVALAAAWAAWWGAAMLLVTVVLVWSAAGYARQAIAEAFGYRTVGLVAWKRYVGKLSLRNFLFS